MSGQQIGSVVGGIIGSFIPVVGTALGSAIGGMIGGMVDPTKVYGPRLSDAQTQTAMDGVPRAYGYGTFPCRGTLIWQDIVKEHKHTDDGKGSGQEQITYTYTRSYAIAVCKGLITGYKIIKRNGKIVFDARTDAELSALGYTSQQIAESRAAQAKFLKVCTLYYGTADQLPDPTMVAVKGVGNVPAYAGTAYIVLTDDETMQGEVAQYEFVVANCGDRTEGGDYARLLVTGSEADASPQFAAAVATTVPIFAAIPTSTGATLGGAVPGFYGGTWIAVGQGELRYSTDDMTTWASADTPWLTSAAESVVGAGAGWLVLNAQFDIDGVPGKAGSPPDDMVEYTFTAGGQTIGSLSSIMVAGGRYYADRAGGGSGTLLTTLTLGEDWDVLCTPLTSTPGETGNYSIRNFLDIVEYDGALYAAVLKNTSNQRGQIRRSTDGGATWPDLILDAFGTVANVPLQLCVGNGELIAYCHGAEYVWTSANDFVEPVATGLAMTKTSNPMAAKLGRQIAFANGMFYIISGSGADTAKANKLVTTADGVNFSSPIPLPLTQLKGIAASTETVPTDHVPIPDADGFYINPTTGQISGPPGTQISICKPTLGSIVSKQCAKRIDVSVIDVSELTDEVVGYRIASPSSPQANIAGTMPGYFFDASEFDGVLHFPKRGGEDSFALTADDLCERDDGDLIQWERTQEPELLRKATTAYMDPDTTYTATTQDWERRSGTVKAEGEGVIELPVVGSKDWAKQVAHKSVKVAWAESDKCTFHTSIAQAKLVTAAVGTIVDEQGTVHRVRIERIEDEGLKRMVEARRTRADVYESTLTGASKPLPSFPGSNIRGPADALLMNIPLLGDTNDVPGIYWAASGYMSGYLGANLQLLRAGQWTDLGTITTPCAMGTLLSDLTLFTGDVDYGSVLHVRMNDDLESVTFHNLLSERNPVAILKPDGTAEIVQFQTATEVAPGEYECTTLIRHRLDTTAAAHEAGARVVFLDTRVRYATLKPEDLGKTLTFRAVSLGTDPDAAPTFDYTLTTMESQREWQPYNATYEAAGSDWTVAFIGRHRLGTDAFPLASVNFRGWRIDFTVGSTTKSRTTLAQEFTYTEAMQIADFGSAQATFDSVTVTATNLYTNGDGAGNPGAGTTATLLEP